LLDLQDDFAETALQLTYISIFKNPIFTNGTKGCAAERYVLDVLIGKDSLTLGFKVTWFTKKKPKGRGKKKDQEEKELTLDDLNENSTEILVSKLTVVQFTGLLPDFVVDLTKPTLFIPEISNHVDCDCILWDPAKNTLYPMQVTVNLYSHEDEYFSLVKYNTSVQGQRAQIKQLGAASHRDLWETFITVNTTKAPKTIFVWIAPNYNKVHGEKLVDRYVVLFETTYDIFPLLDNLVNSGGPRSHCTCCRFSQEKF